MMDMSAIRADETTAITVIFHKSIDRWTPDDQKAIIRRLREFFKRAGKRKPARRSKHAKAGR
jgi:hypothetical protein